MKQGGAGSVALDAMERILDYLSRKNKTGAKRLPSDDTVERNAFAPVAVRVSSSYVRKNRPACITASKKNLPPY